MRMCVVYSHTFRRLLHNSHDGEVYLNCKYSFTQSSVFSPIIQNNFTLHTGNCSLWLRVISFIRASGILRSACSKLCFIYSGWRFFFFFGSDHCFLNAITGLLEHSRARTKIYSVVSAFVWRKCARERVTFNISSRPAIPFNINTNNHRKHTIKLSTNYFHFKVIINAAWQDICCMVWRKCQRDTHTESSGHEKKIKQAIYVFISHNDKILRNSQQTKHKYLLCEFMLPGAR